MAFSTRVVESREYTLVRVQGDDGVAGIGFSYVSNGAGHLAASAVRELLAPLVLGEDAHRVEGIWDALYRVSLVHGRKGVVIRGLSALDIALWDRNARASGLPLWKYLGGAANGKVRCYASGGYYAPDKGPEGLAEEVRTYVSNGYDAVKIKVGRQTPREEAERVAAAREAIGPDTVLMLDANHAYDDVASALSALKLFEKYDPYWIEEPFLPDDVESHRRLAERCSIPVATGELEAGRWDFRDLFEKRAIEFVQPDATGCGGITEFRRIAATASSFGIPICPHWMHDLHVQLAASLPSARWVEYFPDNRVLNFRDLIDNQMEVDNGHLILRDAAGLGFDFKEDVVLAHTIDGWS